MARHLVSPDRVLYIVADEADLDRVVGKPAHIFMTVVTPRDDMEFKQESLRKLLPSANGNQVLKVVGKCKWRVVDQPTAVASLGDGDTLVGLSAPSPSSNSMPDYARSGAFQVTGFLVDGSFSGTAGSLEVRFCAARACAVRATRCQSKTGPDLTSWRRDIVLRRRSPFVCCAGVSVLLLEVPLLLRFGTFAGEWFMEADSESAGPPQASTTNASGSTAY